MKHFPSTRFKHYGIQRLVRVTDKEGNVTTSTYDMGDRRTEVNHPASGITSFTYDALGNVLTKQTANLAKEGKFITYDYDYLRLTDINYPDHPENNVKYYYGGRNASQNRIGRLMLCEDGCHRVLLRQVGRSHQDPPHADCAQPGDCHLCDAVELRQPQPPPGALPESGKVNGWRMPIRIALYRLEIGYDNMHRIVSKKQHLTQQGVQFDDTLHVV